MDVEALIRDLESFSRPEVAPAGAICDDSKHYVPPLTTRWLDYQNITYRDPQDIKRSEQMRAMAHEYYTLSTGKEGRDETGNMSIILTRLSKLAERKQLDGTAQKDDLEPILSRVDVGKTALDDAMFKRQQFMIATKDYTKLPDKMADEIIRYLTRMRPSESQRPL